MSYSAGNSNHAQFMHNSGKMCHEEVTNRINRLTYTDRQTDERIDQHSTDTKIDTRKIYIQV